MDERAKFLAEAGWLPLPCYFCPLLESAPTFWISKCKKFRLHARFLSSVLLLSF